jgi:hypothetical protein
MYVIHILFSLHPLFVGYETRNQCKMLHGSKSHLSHLSHKFHKSYEYPIHYQSWRFLCLLIYSHMPPPLHPLPSIMLIVEPRMMIIFWACTSHTSVKHMLLWPMLVLYPNLTTCHSNIGVQVVFVFNLGTSTSP